MAAFPPSQAAQPAPVDIRQQILSNAAVLFAGTTSYFDIVTTSIVQGRSMWYDARLIRWDQNGQHYTFVLVVGYLVGLETASAQLLDVTASELAFLKRIPDMPKEACYDKTSGNGIRYLVRKHGF